MTTYYVTQDGAGAHNGTSYDDADSIAHANSFDYAANDVVYLCDTIRTALTPHTSGTAGNPVVYRGDYAGHAGKLYGSELLDTWGSYDNDPEGTNLWSCAAAAAVQMVWFVKAGVTYWGTLKASAAACTAEYDWFYASNVVYCYTPANADPDTLYDSIEGAVLNYGIDHNSVTNITIQNLEIAHTVRNGVHMDSATPINWTVTGCTIHHLGTAFNGSYGYGISTRANGGRFNNNTIYECAAGGVNVNASAGITVDDVVIDRNTCYNNYHCDIQLLDWGGTLISNCTISRNLIYSTAAWAYTSGITSHNAIYTQGSGTTFVDEADIYYNVLYNCWGNGIFIGPYSKDVRVYNNTLYGSNASSAINSTGLLLSDDNVTGVLVKNNISMNWDNACFDVGAAASITNDADCNYNCWYHSTGAALFVDVAGQYYHSDDFDANNNYKGDTGWDTNGLWEDPLFVNAATRDFRLQSGSPCRNEGADVSLTEDYAGTIVPLETTPDIGAYEFIPITQLRFRWRMDDGNEDGATWAQAESANITVPAGDVRRLRFLVDTSGDTASVTYQLEMKEANDATWRVVT